MAKWLLVAVAVAAVTWWATRPASGGRVQRKNIKMQQCPRCGVYIEDGSACDCGNKADK